MYRACLLSLVVSFGVSAACGEGADVTEPAEPVPTTPLEAEWPRDTTLKVTGLDGAEGSFYLKSGEGVNPLVVQSSFRGFPEGTEFKVGSHSAKDGYFDVNVLPLIGNLTIEQAAQAVELPLPITITVPNRDPLQTQLPAKKMDHHIATALASVRDRPLKFEGEPDPGEQGKSLAAVQAGSIGNELKVMGPAERIWDIDLVGVYDRKQSERTKSCSGYQNIQGAVTIQMVDYEVGLYDRRTGERLAETVIEAPDDCPGFIMTEGDSNVAKAYAREDDVEDWLRDQLKAQ